MKKLFLMTSIVFTFTISTTIAQNFSQNTTVLAQKLNSLTYDKKEDTQHTFAFKGCDMNMNIKSSGEDVNFGMKISWKMQDVRQIAYKKNKDGYYDFMLDVPADKMKVKLGFGNDNQIGGSFNLNDNHKGNDSKTNFDLKTTDERVVKDLAFRFEEVVKTCKNTK